MHLPTELSLTIMNNEFLDIMKNSISVQYIYIHCIIYIPNCCLNLEKKGLGINRTLHDSRLT